MKKYKSNIESRSDIRLYLNMNYTNSNQMEFFWVYLSESTKIQFA